MMSKNNIALIIFLSGSLLVTSCQRGSRISQLEKQNKQLQEQINNQQPKKLELHLPIVTAAVYQSEKLRDPFESNQVQKSVTGGMNSLNAFPLAMIRFIGIIVHDNEMWAVLITPDNHTYKVTLNDTIGSSKGKIVKINQDQIEVMETILDNQNHPTQRIVILPLKE